MTQVTFQTNMGNITVEVDHENAPIGAENFVHYAMEGFYNGTIFHRIIPGFMVQGGGMLPGMEEKPSGEPIENEADNGLKKRPRFIILCPHHGPAFRHHAIFHEPGGQRFP